MNKTEKARAKQLGVQKTISNREGLCDISIRNLQIIKRNLLRPVRSNGVKSENAFQQIDSISTI